jgi:catalase
LVQAPKPIPTSFAREAFFALTAFRFTNKNGVSRYGRFKIRPEAGTQYLSDADAAKKSPDFPMDEVAERLARGPITFHIGVQIAGDGDDPELTRTIFDPLPRVDGIDPSDDPLIQLRAAIYLLSGRRRRTAAATR